MTAPTSPSVVSTTEGRRVLIWGADSDASHVRDTVEAAAEFLAVPADAIVAAIASGDPVGDWFVDWEAGGAS